jgi:hypothetical protein
MGNGDKSAAEALAERVGSLTPEQRAHVRRALEQRKAAVAAGIPARLDAGPAPLSFSQEALWFLDQWDRGAPTNHGVRALRLRGEVDTEALRSALATIVHRHQALRSVYSVENGTPVQIPLEDWTLTMPLIELDEVDAAQREPELARGLREQSRLPFDLERDLMLRPVLFRLGAVEHVLLLTLHHIAADGWSGGVLFRELSEGYSAHLAGRRPDLPELPIQYADFAVWQRTRLQGRVLDDLLAFWTAELEGAPARLRLPTDRARPTVQMHSGWHLQLSQGRWFGGALLQLVREEGATPYMALLAVFATLLYRFAGQDDVLVGTPVANRNHVEVENLIGLVSNTLVIRNRLDGNPTFRELLQRVRQTVVGAVEHQELPFDKLVHHLRVQRNPSYNPLFQVNFRANAAGPDRIELPGLVVDPVTVDIGFSRFDLALELQLDGERIGGYFEYDENLFDRETIESLAADLSSLLAAVAADPDRPILALAHSRRSGRRPSPPIARTAH